MKSSSPRQVMSFTWATGTLITFVLIGMVALANTAVAVSDTVYRDLREQRYDRVLESLEGDRSGSAHFLRGYIHFEQNNYSESHSWFRRTIGRTDTDHVRHRDALYYLDRLQLYDVSPGEPPTVRVRVDEQQSEVRFDERPTLTVDEPTELRRVTVMSARIQRGTIILETSEGAVRSNSSVRLSVPDGADPLRYNGVPYRGSLILHKQNDRLDVINELPVPMYLYGVVRKELAPGWPVETLKAQAVASRSFVVHHILEHRDRHYDVSATETSQVYGGIEAETPRIKRAVDRTRGEVLTRLGMVVPAYFHANSGGYIESPETVWGGEPTSFIEPKRDPWSLKADKSRWDASVSLSTVNDRLRKAGHPALSGDGSSLQVAETLQSGRARTIEYSSTEGQYSLSGNDFRVAVGTDRLKSAWFEGIRVRGNEIDFEGRGWGHGVGMSQWGARRMAEDGSSYREILQFYYEPPRIVGEWGPATVATAQ